MTKKISKLKKLTRAKNKEQKKIEAEKKIAKTMIFCKPNSSTLVKQLVSDFRSMMEPNTVKEVYSSRSYTLKDYIAYATKVSATNLMYFTHARSTHKTCDWNESTNYERGGVYCHNIVMPHGPSFTYRVREYELKRDIQTLTGFGMNKNWLQKPPYIILNGFKNASNVNYLKSVCSSFQNMLPELNINTMKISSAKRAILVCRREVMPETDVTTQNKLGEVLVLRHYFIKLENRELNKNIRKLGVGVTSKNVKIPNLANYGSIDEYIARNGCASETEMSDMDGEVATIELKESIKELPGSTGKTAIRLLEVGPRLVLQLIKIHEGIHSGALLYHRFVKRTQEEMFELEKKRAEKLKLKEKRREQQLKNVESKKKLKLKHKEVCLKGMEAKGYVKKSESDCENEQEETENVADVNEKIDDGDLVDDDDLSEEVEDIEISDEEDEMEEVNDSLDEDVNDSLDDDEEDEMEEVNDSLDEDVNDSLDDDEEDEMEEDGIEDVNDSLDENSENDKDLLDKDHDSDSDDIKENSDSDSLDLHDDESESNDLEVELPKNIQNLNPVQKSKKRPHFKVDTTSKKRKL